MATKRRRKANKGQIEDDLLANARWSGLKQQAELKARNHSVQMTCLQGLADLERLEGPWLDGLATGNPEVAATTVRLLLAHLTWNSKRLLGAMVLDRLDAESLSTRAEFPDRCQRLVNGLDSVNGLNP